MIQKTILPMLCASGLSICLSLWVFNRYFFPGEELQHKFGRHEHANCRDRDFHQWRRGCIARVLLLRANTLRA